MTTCSLCRQPVECVYIERDRITVAVDPDPSPAGYFEKVSWHVPGVGGVPVVRRLVGQALVEARARDDAELYRTHFMTCPKLAERRQASSSSPASRT